MCLLAMAWRFRATSLEPEAALSVRRKRGGGCDCGLLPLNWRGELLVDEAGDWFSLFAVVVGDLGEAVGMALAGECGSVRPVVGDDAKLSGDLPWRRT